MQCPNCNKEIGDSSLFCSFCGCKIENTVQNTTSEANQTVPEAVSVNEEGQKTNLSNLIEKVRNQAPKIFKISTLVGAIGVAGFLMILLVGLIGYGRIYFFNGYAFTKVLCVIDLILMLFGAIGLAVGLIFLWKECFISKKKKMISIVIAALAILFSVILMINSAANKGKKHSSSSGTSSGYSYQMNHSTYCLLYMKVSNVKLTHSGNYAYISGTIKNTGTYQIKYVKVRAACKNSSGAIIDTDWTYAVDSDWLNPGESKTFEMMVADKGKQIKTAQVTVVND